MYAHVCMYSTLHGPRSRGIYIKYHTSGLTTGFINFSGITKQHFLKENVPLDNQWNKETFREILIILLFNRAPLLGMAFGSEVN